MVSTNTIEIVIIGRDNASNVLNNLGRNTRRVGRLALAGFGLAAVGIGAVGAAALSAGLTLDRAFDTIAVGSGATGETLEQLNDDFRKLFAGLPASAETVSNVVADLNTRLGVTGDALQELAAPLIEASRLLGGDATQNTALFTRVLGDWAIGLEDSGAALDKLFVTSQNTGIGLEQLQRLTVQFGAPLRQMGFEFEEVISLLGSFEKEGVNTELVLGSLRIAANNFAQSGTSLTEGLQQTIDAIKNAATETEALSIAADVFGARSGPDMAAAILENRFEFSALVDALADSEGAILRTAAATESFTEKFQRIRNRITLALEPLGKLLLNALDGFLALTERALPPLISIVQGALLPIFERIANSVQAFLTIFERGDGIAAAFSRALFELTGSASLADRVFTIIGSAIKAFNDVVAPAISSISKFISENVKLQDVLIAVGIAIASIVIPFIGGLVIAFAPIILAAVALVGAIALVRKAFETDFLSIRTVALPALLEFGDNLITNVLPKIIAFAQVVGPIILNALQQVSEFITTNIIPSLLAFGNFLIEEVVPRIVEFAAIVGPLIIEGLSILGDFITNTVIPVLGSLANFILEEVVPRIITFAQVAGPILIDAFSAIVGFVRDTIIPGLGDFADFFTAVILPALGDVSDFITGTVVPALVEISTIVIETVISALSDLADFITSDVLPVLGDMATFFIDDILPAIVDVIELGIRVLITVLTEVADFIVGTVLPVLGDIAGFFIDTVLPAIVDIIELGFRALLAVFGEVADFITGTVIPVIGRLVDLFLAGLPVAIDGVKGFLQGLLDILDSIVGGVGRVIDAIGNLGNIQLPSIPSPGGIIGALIPGSPTILEQGILQTQAALQNFATAIPGLVDRLQGLAVPGGGLGQPLGAPVAAGQGATQTFNFNFGTEPTSPQEAIENGRMIADEMRRQGVV